MNFSRTFSKIKVINCARWMRKVILFWWVCRSIDSLNNKQTSYLLIQQFVITLFLNEKNKN